MGCGKVTNYYMESSVNVDIEDFKCGWWKRTWKMKDNKERNKFFISDTHFNHSNVITYCDRPFRDLDDMKKYLIYRWNRVVSEDDIVYVLGDFIMGLPKDIHEILSKLNGYIILVRGNHDTDSKINIYQENYPDKIEVRDLAYIKDGKDTYICSHYPMFVGEWDNGRNNKLYVLSGHTHSKKNFYDNIPLNYHVGVDANDFSPISFDIVKNRLKEREKLMCQNK